MDIETADRLLGDVNAARAVALGSPSIRTRAEIVGLAATVIEAAGQLVFVSFGIEATEERRAELHNWADNAAAELVLRAAANIGGEKVVS